MARTRRTPEGARSTTVYLSAAQRGAIRKLQSIRLEKSGTEPTLNEVFMEGLRKLLSEEGWAESQLGQTFPKQDTRQTNVTRFRKPKVPS